MRARIGYVGHFHDWRPADSRIKEWRKAHLLRSACGLVRPRSQLKQDVSEWPPCQRCLNQHSK